MYLYDEVNHDLLLVVIFVYGNILDGGSYRELFF